MLLLKNLLIFRLWIILFTEKKSSSKNIYLFKVNNRNTSKLIVKTPERLSIVFIY